VGLTHNVTDAIRNKGKEKADAGEKWDERLSGDEAREVE
jgi:hypothetical protein